MAGIKKLYKGNVLQQHLVEKNARVPVRDGDPRRCGLAALQGRNAVPFRKVCKKNGLTLPEVRRHGRLRIFRGIVRRSTASPQCIARQSRGNR